MSAELDQVRTFKPFTVGQDYIADIFVEEEVLRARGSLIVPTETQGLLRVALADSPGEYVALGLVVLDRDLHGRLVSSNLSPNVRGLEGRKALIVAPDSTDRRRALNALRQAGKERKYFKVDPILDAIRDIDEELAQALAGQWPTLLQAQKIQPEEVIKAEFRTRVSR